MSTGNAVNKDLQFILGSEVFLALINCDIVKIAELQAAVGLLLKAGITFDLIFDRATPRSDGVAVLIIFINPTLQLRFTVNVGTGPFIPPA